ncbi:MAG: peptidase and in kexin sedolisin [Thermoleophilia bacterium]|nr:peptidase and in kexin sedolisin [Thermoleophilia bacterium]
MPTLRPHGGLVHALVLCGALTLALCLPAVSTAFVATGSGSGSVPSNIDPTGNGAPGVEAYLLDGPDLHEGDIDGTERDLAIRLRSRPTSPVIIAFTTYEVDVPGGAISIEPSQWATPRIVHVRARQDPVAETSPHPATIGFTVSGDAGFAGFWVPPITTSVLDDDLAGASCSPGAGWNSSGHGGTVRLEEGGASANCSLQLTATPSTDLTLTASTNDPDVQVTPSVITIPAGSVAPVAVQLHAREDNIDRQEHRDVTLSWRVATSDPMYGAIGMVDAGIDLVDNDTAGVTLSSHTVRTREGSSAEIVTIRMATEPTAPVTFVPNADMAAGVPQVRATAAGASLEVLPSSWATPRSLSIAAIDDDRAEGAHRGSVDLAIVTSDPAYARLHLDTIGVELEDNDLAGVVFTPTDGGTSVAERGTTDVVDVRLATAPTSDITVELEGGGGIAVEPRSLTFAAASWRATQRVTVSALDDADVEPAATVKITARTHGTDPAYLAGGSAPPSTHDVMVQSDDLAQVVLTVSSGSTAVAEGGAGDEYTLALAARPTTDVTVSVEASGGEVAVDPARVTFTPSSWSTAQPVRVTATEDTKDEPTPHKTSIRNVVVAGDATWKNVAIPDVLVDITDNDETTSTSDPDPTTDGGSGGGDEATDDESGDRQRTTRVLPRVPAAVIRSAITESGAVRASGDDDGFRMGDRSARGANAVTQVPGAVLAQPATAPSGQLISGPLPDAARRERARSRERAIAAEAAARAPIATRAADWAVRHPVASVPAAAAGAAGGLFLLTSLFGDPFSAGRQGASLVRQFRRRP